MNSNRKILLYPHGGCDNHGCEAIIRSTAMVLSGDHILFSNAPQQDFRFGLNEICEIKPLRAKIKRNLDYLSASFQYRFLSDIEAFDRLAFRNILNEAKKSDLALSIGGDNYCYGVPKHLIFINKELQKIGIPLVLWGCSIEPTAIDEFLLEDLRRYQLIVSRESLTTSALKKHGLKNVMQMPDPAFMLSVSQVKLPDWWKKNDTIGINVSPMVLNYSHDGSLTLSNFEGLINYILSSTQATIALIPHVTWSHDDDRIPLKYLYRKYIDSGRVHIINDGYNAEQLKWLISNCRALVTSRTHASIAAYSTAVPTIVVGYSVKAHGIAHDLFGSDDIYVLPAQNIQSEDMLKNMFKHLIENESIIKSCLHDKIEKYHADILNVKTLINCMI